MKMIAWHGRVKRWQPLTLGWRGKGVRWWGMTVAGACDEVWVTVRRKAILMVVETTIRAILRFHFLILLYRLR